MIVSDYELNKVLYPIHHYGLVLSKTFPLNLTYGKTDELKNVSDVFHRNKKTCEIVKVCELDTYWTEVVGANSFH